MCVVRMGPNYAISARCVGVESKVTAPFNTATVDLRVTSPMAPAAVVKLVTGFFMWGAAWLRCGRGG